MIYNFFSSLYRRNKLQSMQRIRLHTYRAHAYTQLSCMTYTCLAGMSYLNVNVRRQIAHRRGPPPLSQRTLHSKNIRCTNNIASMSVAMFYRVSCWTNGSLCRSLLEGLSSIRFPMLWDRRGHSNILCRYIDDSIHDKQLCLG